MNNENVLTPKEIIEKKKEEMRTHFSFILNYFAKNLSTQDSYFLVLSFKIALEDLAEKDESMKKDFKKIHKFLIKP